LPAAILNGVFTAVFPDDCRVCGSPLREFSRIPVCSFCLRFPEALSAEHFCAQCHTAFLNPKPLDENGLCTLCAHGLCAFDRVYSVAEYEGRVRRLIHLLKYGGMKGLAKPLGRMMLAGLPREEKFDLIVPMPLHWTRRLRRGFNQAELLAKCIAARFRLPIVRGLRRKRRTPVQAGLTHAERRDNVAGAFSVRKISAVRDRHVLLIDDVLTTGATVNSAAAALRHAGARRVTVLTLARVDRRKSGSVYLD
jgi:ComF family protein